MGKSRLSRTLLVGHITDDLIASNYKPIVVGWLRSFIIALLFFPVALTQAAPTPTLTTKTVSATTVNVNQAFTVSTTLQVSSATAEHAGSRSRFPR